MTERVGLQDVICVCLETEENRSDHLETFQGAGEPILRVLYEDADLLVVENRPGWPAIPPEGITGIHWQIWCSHIF